MSFWDFESVRGALGGRWAVEPPRRPGTHPMGASIDTRTLAPGEVFFALPGERTDGHDHIAAAVGAGSPMVVAQDQSRVPERTNAGVVIVDDVAGALSRLASAYRAQLSGVRVVGVTGSNGKTTAVRLIDAALRGELRGSRSRKSYNNHLGLPLTVLGVRPGDQYVVCEMGTSGPGEIERLTKVARPDVAVITSIGRAHLEELGSIAGVAREKSAILRHAREGAVGCVPAGSAELEDVLAGLDTNRLFRVGGPETNADVIVSNVRPGARSTRFEIAGWGAFEVPMTGAHNAHNGAIAAFVGRRLGLTDDAVRAGLLNADPEPGRLTPVTIRGTHGSVRLIDDSYNANPESVRAAIATLATARPSPGGRRVAVLGDMLELGDASDGAHAEIVTLIGSTRKVHAAVLVGGAMGGAADHGGGKAIAVGGPDDGAIERAASMIEPGDVVLVKGSRSVRLERLRAALERRLGAPAGG